jgi:hypothetical protein
MATDGYGSDGVSQSVLWKVVPSDGSDAGATTFYWHDTLTFRKALYHSRQAAWSGLEQWASNAVQIATAIKDAIAGLAYEAVSNLGKTINFVVNTDVNTIFETFGEFTGRTAGLVAIQSFKKSLTVLGASVKGAGGAFGDEITGWFGALMDFSVPKSGGPGGADGEGTCSEDPPPFTMRDETAYAAKKQQLESDKAAGKVVAGAVAGSAGWKIMEAYWGLWPQPVAAAARAANDAVVQLGAAAANPNGALQQGLQMLGAGPGGRGRLQMPQ